MAITRRSCQIAVCGFVVGSDLALDAGTAIVTEATSRSLVIGAALPRSNGQPSAQSSPPPSLTVQLPHRAQPAFDGVSHPECVALIRLLKHAYPVV